MVSKIKGLLDPGRDREISNCVSSPRGKTGRVHGKDPSLKSVWRGTSAIRGPVPKWVTAPSKLGRGHDFKAPGGPLRGDRRRHVTAKLSFVARGKDYAGKVTGNAKYLARKEAVERDIGHETYLAKEGPFFTKDSDGVTAGTVAKACANDPRQFRLIVNPDDGDKFSVKEMKGFVREYMARVEREVGARIGWAAVIHKADTTAKENSRHTHIIIRGRDQDGNVLRFAKPFVKEGFRSIARDMVTERLGHLSEREMEQYRQRFENNRERNAEWKRLEREGASMSRKRGFAKEDTTKEAIMARSPSRGYRSEPAYERA